MYPAIHGFKETMAVQCTCVLNLPSSAKQRDITIFFNKKAPLSPSSFAHLRRAPSLARFSISAPPGKGKESAPTLTCDQACFFFFLERREKKLGRQLGPVCDCCSDGFFLCFFFFLFALPKSLVSANVTITLQNTTTLFNLISQSQIYKIVCRYEAL